MSGPKVVRVVTREELEAICLRQIAISEAAVKQLMAIMRRHDLIEPGLAAGLSGRRDELMALLKDGKFRQVQQRAAALTEFCRTEAARLEAKAAAAIEAARSRRRRLSDTARSVVAAIEAVGRVPPQELIQAVSGSLAASDTAMADCERVVERALKSLVSQSQGANKASGEVEELAKRLGAGGGGLSLTAWLDENRAQVEPADGRLDKVMAEVELLGDAGLVEEFARRAAKIAGEASTNQRRLLTDSLVLDVGNTAKQLRAREAFRTQLLDVHAALTTYVTDQARQQGEIVARALGATTFAIDQQLLTNANAVVEQAQLELAAAARRKAILGGLAALGYEVREGMATAWTQNGRLVVRKPNATDYGVELAAPGDAARLQVRIVGSANPVTARNAARDRDQETTWCSEFAKLSELVAGSGGDIVVERAVEVGAQPVKTVAFEGTVAAHSADDALPRQRTL
jgi:hypothetical protein